MPEASTKKRVVIILILISVLAIFAYVRKEIFFQQAKKLIKQNLERNLPCRISIGKIKSGLLQGLILEDLEIVFPETSGFVISIRVDEARTDYNLWRDFFTKAEYGRKDVRRLRLISPDLRLFYSAGKFEDSDFSQTQQKEGYILEDFTFTLEDGQISFGNYQKVLLKNLYGKVLLNQKGLYFQDIRATLKDNLNKLKFYGEFSQDRLSLTANLEHLKIKNFDILTNLSLSCNKKFDLYNKAPKISGSLKTYGSVLNSRPFPELNSSFEIQDNKLRILTFSLGDSYDLRGIVSLSAPNNCDLSLNFYQAAPHELIWLFSSKGEQDFAGLVNGLIKVTGELARPKVEGYLEVRDGYIGKLDFVSADINIKGRYPRILIVDSRVRREKGFFIMEGEIDFADLEGQDFLDIKFKADKGILWQGWDITRMRDNQVHMSKSITDEFKITFDAFMEDETRAYNDNYPNELGLEYRIFGDKLLKLRLRRQEEILGLERRIKF